MDIYIYPEIENDNKYIKLISDLFKGDFNVRYIPKLKSLPPFLFKSWKKANNACLILNWYEDKVSVQKLLPFTLGVLYLLLFKLMFKKIIWIKHNLKPHSGKHYKRYNLMCRLLERVSSEKITHRHYADFSYVPHPTYRVDASYDLKKFEERDIDNLYFGIIKRYKGIPELLANWPREKQLSVIGRCEDSVLFQEIANIIDERCLQVDFQNRFISDEELNSLLCRTKTVILPHKKNSMIVSGAFYHAASFGASVALNEGEFYDYLKGNFSFVRLINEDLTECQLTSDIRSELLSECSDKIIRNELSRLLYNN
ncbi:hypothetical protein L3Q72_08085 [Vibrio sp. JC009]|uniref:hypothetical protein n=1 Tax=Vibrio sp. JC009 TaxID=2912314 RepID=UPI0023B0D318|nr:hypothetical protein [Vibrio sp. JC009]WED20611.1 hypothetical protein L3Q72_08085 [Vibrio sp. JC009]